MAVKSVHPDIDRLRRRLDRSVAAASAFRLLGWCGRAACIAALAGTIVAAIDMACGPLPPGIARLAVIGIAVCGAVAAWRLGADPRPRRLDVAIAAEAVAPGLGERISRAVEFFDDEPAATARGMKHLALAEAAAAAATLPRLPVPGIRGHACWLAAGCAAVGCLAATTVWPHSRIAPEAGRGVTTQSTSEERSSDVGRLADLATAIAASAAIESRLAESLGDRFPRSPGVMAEELPAAEARDLDRLARLHDGLAQEIGRSRDAVAALAASEPAADEARARLDAIDAAFLADATAAIAGHRLGIAARLAAQAAAALAAAARDLGWTESLPEDRLAAVPADAPPGIRRLAATLAELEDRPPATADTAAEVDSSGQPAPGGRPAPPFDQTAAPGAADAGGTATTEPRFGTGAGPQEIAMSPPVAGPTTRAWSRLPARVRPVLPRGAEPDVPAAYRRAVDLYYKSLAAGLRADPTIPPPPRP